MQTNQADLSRKDTNESNEIRVAVLCSAHPLGDARVVSRQALSLAKFGYQVAVFGRDDPSKTLPQHPRLRLIPIAPMTYDDSFKSRFRRIQVLRRMAAAVQEFRPQIVACHEPETALLAALRLRRLGCKIHFDVHECFEELAATKSPAPIRGLARAVANTGMRWLVRRAHWVTVVSPANFRAYAKILDASRLHILHNSHPLESFPPCTQDVAGPVSLVHDGWLDDSRGMEQMLRAVALARRSVDVRLLLVGGVRKSCDQRFAALSKELELKPYLDLPGWVPYDRLGETDAKAQVGLVALQPSGNNFGGLSNKVYSYMSCGQPVIVPNGSETAELVRRYNCGIAVDITQPTAIAEAMVTLAQSAELRKRLGDNGRRAVETELGWHKMEETLRRGYEQLCRPVLGGLNEEALARC